MPTGVIIFLILLLLFAIGGGFGTYYYMYMSEPAIVAFINENYSKPGKYGMECGNPIHMPKGVISVVGDKLIMFLPNGQSTSATITKKEDELIVFMSEEEMSFKLLDNKLWTFGKENGKPKWMPFPVKKCP